MDSPVNSGQSQRNSPLMQRGDSCHDAGKAARPRMRPDSASERRAAVPRMQRAYRASPGLIKYGEGITLPVRSSLPDSGSAHARRRNRPSLGTRAYIGAAPKRLIGTQNDDDLHLPPFLPPEYRSLQTALIMPRRRPRRTRAYAWALMP